MMEHTNDGFSMTATTMTNNQEPDSTAQISYETGGLQSQTVRLMRTAADDREILPLPEDDGMQMLRRRITMIQIQEVNSLEKARLMHELLTEGYTKSQLATHGRRQWSLASPLRTSSIATHRSASMKPLTGPLETLKSWYPLGESHAQLSLPLTEEDLRPTHVPVPVPDGLDPQFQQIGVQASSERHLGCAHYRRNVKMQCVACERWYTCRFCHDAVETHRLPRHETKNMLCMLCGCAQRVSDTCIKCGEMSSRYYCQICKLWNNDPEKPIYHCHDCNICRVGQGIGRDFFHCHKCHACIAISISESHKCIERAIDCDCPICGEHMFSSPMPVVFMKCGHSIHRLCYNEHMKTSYRCPICSKSCVNMEMQFRSLEMAILSQPMPDDYRDTRAIVQCHDCRAKSQTVFHWLGLRCSVCHSYNTAQLQLLNLPSNPPGQDTAGGQSPMNRAARALLLPFQSMPGSDYSSMVSDAERASNALPQPPHQLPILLTSPTRAWNGDARSLSLRPDLLRVASDATEDASINEGGADEDIIGFWGRETTHPTSADSNTEVHVSPGGDDSSEMGSDDEECTDEEDDDEEEEEIVLLGHR